MKISVKSVLLAVAGILGIAAFCMLFLDPLKIVTTTIIGDGQNVTQLGWQSVYFGDQDANMKGATFAFIGFLAMGIGGLLALLTAIVGRKGGLLAALLGIIAVVLIVGGGIVAICTKQIYMSANGMESDTIDIIVAKGTLQLSTGPVVGAVLGFVGGAAALLGTFMPAPRKGKRR